MPSSARNTIAPGRRAAYAVLRRVFERGAYADEALQAEAKGLDARERAQAMRLAYGTVQRKGTLDHLIGRLAERPPDRLDPPVLSALRLGLYELLYLDGSPDYAVLADAVQRVQGVEHFGRVANDQQHFFHRRLLPRGGDGKRFASGIL